MDVAIKSHFVYPDDVSIRCPSSGHFHLNTSLSIKRHKAGAAMEEEKEHKQEQEDDAVIAAVTQS